MGNKSPREEQLNNYRNKDLNTLLLKLKALISLKAGAGQTDVATSLIFSMVFASFSARCVLVNK